LTERFGETFVQFRAPLQGASHATNQQIAAELFLSVDAVKGPRALQVGVRQPINLTKCRRSSSDCSQPHCFRS
jgi:hypothetical protein